MWCISLSLWDLTWSLSDAILLLCFHPGMSHAMRTGFSVSHKQTVRDGGHTVLWKFEEGDRVPFRKPSGMCMGKPEWASGISSKTRSAARVQRLHHGRDEPVFVIRSGVETVNIVHSLTVFFFCVVLLVLWFTYKVPSSLTPSDCLPKIPTQAASQYRLLFVSIIIMEDLQRE